MSKYVGAKLLIDGAMSKQQRLRKSGMCMFLNVALREATEQQRKLTESESDGLHSRVCWGVDSGRLHT